MPILPNTKHERFAHLLAKGLKQGDAYIEAGYSPNKGAASRLAQSPKLIDRVSEIKSEINKRINTAMANPDEPEHFKSLKEMGITMDWIGAAYHKIYEKAVETAQLGAANTAVNNLQKLVEIEQGGRTNDENTEDRVKISDAVKLVESMTKLAQAHTKSREPMKDVTPKDAVPALPVMESLDDFLMDDED